MVSRKCVLCEKKKKKRKKEKHPARFALGQLKQIPCQSTQIAFISFVFSFGEAKGSFCHCRERHISKVRVIFKWYAFLIVCLLTFLYLPSCVSNIFTCLFPSIFFSSFHIPSFFHSCFFLFLFAPVSFSVLLALWLYTAGLPHTLPLEEPLQQIIFFPKNVAWERLRNKASFPLRL